jgi:ABC-2 type transport system permease protein
MSGSVFIEELKRGWLGSVVWGVGMAALMLFLMAIIQNNEVIDQYRVILEAMPQGVLKAFGVSSVEILTTAEGFVAFAGFTYGALILSVYGGMSGLGITANDEDEGSLNMLLAMPIHRWQVIVEKYAAYALMLLGIVLLMFSGIAAGSAIFNVPMNLTTMLLGVLNLMPLSLAVMASTCLIASLISRKFIVSGIAAAFVVASYFLNVLAGSLDTEAVPAAGVLQKLSLFSYVDSEGLVLNGGLNTLNISLLLGLSVVLVVISVLAFERRDIGG